MNSNIRNVLIVLVIAALVVAIPGGGTGANVALQAASLVFLGALAWVASVMYRQHRTDLYSLGDGRRAALYAAVAVATVTLTATGFAAPGSLEARCGAAFPESSSAELASRRDVFATLRGGRVVFALRFVAAMVWSDRVAR